MGDFLVDTKIRLGQCNRCDQWVYLAQSGGLRSAADVVPCARDAYIAALTDGRRVFRLATAAGKPHKLLAHRLTGAGPTFDAGGAQSGVQSFLVEHGCGGHARNMITFREVETEGPPPAPVTPGRHRGGHHQPDAHGMTVEQIPRSAAAPATRRRSDAGTASSGWTGAVCGTCRCRIAVGDAMVGVQHGHLWVWAEHEEGGCR